MTCEVSAAQAALVRVLERSWVVLAEKDSGGVVAEEEGKEAYCGMLADRSQIGAVLGLGGKNVEWMRRNSGAMIRVLPPPSCGASSDELIQVCVLSLLWLTLKSKFKSLEFLHFSQLFFQSLL